MRPASAFHTSIEPARPKHWGRTIKELVILLVDNVLNLTTIKSMNPLVFARLGFKINSSLSEIQREESLFSTLVQTLDFSKGTNVLDLLNDKIQFYKTQMNISDNLQPFIKKGYEYSKKNENPSLQKIVTDFDSELLQNNYLQSLLKEIDVPSPKKEIINEVTNVFIAVAKGFTIGQALKPLEEMFIKINKNKSYFSKIPLPIKLEELKNQVDLAEIMHKCEFTLDISLQEFESQTKKISELKKEFLAIKSPDLAKTINDRIEMLSEKIKKAERTLLGNETLHRIGYLIGIRGENPTLFELLRENSRYIKYDIWTSFPYTEEFKGDEVTNAKKTLLFILEGYAYSYHINFLENELKKITSPNAEAINKLIKLKWTGQKNQIYSILRELKNKGFIENSYEDLAVFLKQNVDSFQNTSISTIIKEIGKDKKPPKNKRIELKY